MAYTQYLSITEDLFMSMNEGKEEQEQQQEQERFYIITEFTLDYPPVIDHIHDAIQEAELKYITSGRYPNKFDAVDKFIQYQLKKDLHAQRIRNLKIFHITKDMTQYRP